MVGYNECSCCNHKIGSMDLGYRVFHREGTEIRICGKCVDKIKRGDLQLSNLDIVACASEINPSYSVKQAVVEAARKVEEEKIKVSAQRTDPLYEDIHQIATDLHFIKTVLVIGIIIGAVACILPLLT